MKSDRVLWAGLFSLELPEGWIFEQDEDIITISREGNGVGALQISFVKRLRQGEATRGEALELALYFIRARGWEVPLDQICLYEVGSSPVSEFDHIDPSIEYSSCRTWHILAAKRAACATYVSREEDASLESAECRAIIESFRWEQDAL
jgi:hypothetical protein